MTMLEGTFCYDVFFFFSSRRRHTRLQGDWSSDVCSSDLIVVWGKQAEIVREHLAKGKQVYVEGSIQTRQWDDREGNKRTTTEIRAQRFLMLGRVDPGEPRMTSAAPPESVSDEPGGPPPDDDIPF